MVRADSSRKGIVAAGDPQTAEAAAAVLREGGTAVDAVCAAAFAAFVVEMPLCSPAGAGVLLSGDRERGFSILDFFAVAPGLEAEAEADGARPPLDFHDVTVDFGPATQVFHVGRAAAAVPTALFGLLRAHREGGTMPLTDLIAPATRLARSGYELSAAQAWVFDLLEPIATLTPGARSLFCDGDRLARTGARLRNPALADFLEALAREGEALLRGELAEQVVATFGPGAGGLVTTEDLRRYEPTAREPLRVRTGDAEVLLNPPPSSGGALIALGLHIAEAIGFERLDFMQPEHVSSLAALHAVLSEIRAAGYDDRIRKPGSIDELLAMAAVSRAEARVRALREGPSLGSTTHISVLDGRDGAASLTISNGEGCGHVLERYGIHMNNFLGEEDINPGGFHRLPPGLPMTTMMSPTVVVADGRPVLALGSGGSNRIRGAILQVLLNRLLYRRPLAECVQAPRLHVEGEQLWFEETGLPDESREQLSARWPEHTPFPTHSMFFGGVHVAARDGEELVGAGDGRRGGSIAIP